MLTVRQFKDGSKDVTRRLGWLDLKVGELLQGCKKCQGRKNGEPLVKLGVIRVKSVRRERLDALMAEHEYGFKEVGREGFRNVMDFGRDFVQKHLGSVLYPSTATPRPEQFIKFFCKSHKGCTPETLITRIEFEHVDSVNKVAQETQLKMASWKSSPIRIKFKLE